MVDLEIFDPSEPALLDCIKFCFISIVQIELTDTANKWTHHLPTFMQLQTTRSLLTLQKLTNLLILPALYLLTSLMSLVSLQRHWRIKITWKCDMMYQLLLNWTYIFWAKSRNTRLNEATKKSVTDTAGHVSSFDQNQTKTKTWNKKVLIVATTSLPKMSWEKNCGEQFPFPIFRLHNIVSRKFFVF